MSNYVYLFELDSVKRTPEEIVAGQKALYREIAVNGNTVVLTYNQLVDSCGFFEMLKNADYEDTNYYAHLVSLFECGAICISQYGDIRTVAQYLLNSIDSGRAFRYSAIPVKANQPRLIALMRRSLIYSDLSEIKTYSNQAQKAEGRLIDPQSDLADLFVEIENGNEKLPALETHKIQKILNDLYWIMSMVLRISAMDHAYISPKSPAEYANHRLPNYLDAVTKFQANTIQKDACEDWSKHWTDAVEIVKRLLRSGTDSRSDLLNLLQKENREDSTHRCAEFIINLCYNYACEMSIRDTAKRYNENEFPEDSSKSFYKDFVARMDKEWDMLSTICENAARLKEDAQTELPVLQVYSIRRKFARASRLCRYAGLEKNSFQQQKGPQWWLLTTATLKRVVVLCLCFGIAYGVDAGLQWVQSMIETSPNTSEAFWLFLRTVLSLVVAETITTLLEKLFKGFISLSEALAGIGIAALDLICVLAETVSVPQKPTKTPSATSGGDHLVYPVKTRALRKYIQFKRENNTSPLMSDSDVYPLADTEDENVLRVLLRQEEVQHRKYGLVYESAYHKILVDPIVGGKNGYFPYERVIPAKGNGVVMVTMCNGKFILLQQYRHAIRREQYGFPRGFAETDLTANANARKELSEELGTVSTVQIPLGKIAPDSGLTGSCVDVFLTEIDHYSAAKGHEGIQRHVELTEAELEKMIADGSIDDGFTLGAYTLYKIYRKKQAFSQK